MSAAILSALAGYVSLSQEMVWVRLMALATSDSPRAFAYLLGIFLGGLAAGARLSPRVLARGREAALVFAGILLLSASLVFFFSAPAAGFFMAAWGAPGVVLLFLAIGATGFLNGGLLPLLAHLGMEGKPAAGQAFAGIYLANIAGSAAGPLVTGFVLMDRLPLQDVLLVLALAGAVLGGTAILMTSRRAAGTAAALLCAAALVLGRRTGFSKFLESYQYQQEAPSTPPFRHVLQNRCGIITVEPNAPDTVYGDGVYDGRMSLDLLDDANGIRRAHMTGALHPDPRDVLEIGLGAGAWARALSGNTGLRNLTVVEINPGYREIVERYPVMAPVLSDPRVALVVDDGRRWLRRNPARRFDLIVMNTSLHWRNHATHLLSREFLRQAKDHLKEGGMVYLNATYSPWVPRTAAVVFQHVVMFGSFVAASDAPFAMTPEERRAGLLRFERDGRPAFDERNPALRALLTELTTQDLPDQGETLRAGGLPVITDDNMATEFKADRRLADPRRAWDRLWE